MAKRQPITSKKKSPTRSVSERSSKKSSQRGLKRTSPAQDISNKTVVTPKKTRTTPRTRSTTKTRVVTRTRSSTKNRVATPKIQSTQTIKIRKKHAVIFPVPTWKVTLGQAIENAQKSLVNTRQRIGDSVTQTRVAVGTRITNQLAQAASFKLQFSVFQRKKKKAGRPIRKKKPLVFKKVVVLVSPKSTAQPASRFQAGVWKVGRGIKMVVREVTLPFWLMVRHHPFLTLFSILTSILILVGSYAVYDIIFKDLPSVDQISVRKQILTTRILDRHGELLYRIYKDENRTLVPLQQIPSYMRQATIAIEDKDFYNHQGFSPRGIIRAFTSNLKGEQLQGGSTITQQLVKNTLLSSERTYKRKVREILLAFLMERTYSKNEILEMYLNEVSYGGSTYGVEEAAQRYFGKAAHQLTLAEAAFLAGLPAAPSVYSPFGATPEYAYVRQKEVLRRMVEDQYITEEQAQQARNEVLTFIEDSTNIKAPHFVMYIRNLLAKEYGEDMVNQGGLEVRTTLDLGTQQETQKIVTDEMASLARLRINNGAALITNPKTGEIIAMVGSKNYFDFANDGQVNVTLRPRQPGSSIKPLTYAIAFENGKSPSSTILDEPVSFSLPGAPPYAPKNYDGRFHGNVTLREALGSSYNIPAVKTLASIGINTLIDKGEAMGISTWKDRKRFGLSLTLGGGEVLMVDLAQIYGTFANSGNTVSLNPLLEVKDAKGTILYHNKCALEKTDCPSKRTLNPKVAYQITDVLSDNNARTPAFGPRSVLTIPGQQVAVKTGTTNNLRDNWTIGYTTDRVVAVWVGNNDNKPMSYVASGVTGASPIWNKIIRTQLDDAQPHVFSQPEGMIKVKICVKTGTLPCAGCPFVRDEIFMPGTEPTQACNPAQFRPRPADGQPQPVQPNSTNGNSERILDGISIGQ